MEKSFIDLISITEVAAIATYEMIGRNDKENADGKAVLAMEYMLNKLPVSAEVVIGEGDIDEAPQLYLGQKLGTGGEAIEIAVDPIEGTKMVAKNQSNAIAVMALTPQGGFFSAPDMYMEKLIVGKKLAGEIDLSKSIISNIKHCADVLQKDVCDMTIALLDKERHYPVIDQITELGARVALIPDGDVVVSIDICHDEKYDMFYSIGGSPEGVINAAVVSCLGGDMQARLVSRVDAKGESTKNREYTKEEQQKCNQLGIEIGQIMKYTELAKNDDIIVLATGITNGDLLAGVQKIDDDNYKCSSIFMRKNTGTLLKINSTHDMSQKDQKIKQILKTIN